VTNFFQKLYKKLEKKRGNRQQKTRELNKEIMLSKSSVGKFIWRTDELRNNSTEKRRLKYKNLSYLLLGCAARFSRHVHVVST
jgi:hypothetical protein